MVAPALTPDQRETALGLFLDYVVANERGFIVAMLASRPRADEIAATNPHWYSVYHLSDLTTPVSVAA